MNWPFRMFFQTVLCTYTSWRYIAHTLDATILKAFPNKGKDEIKIIDVAAGTGLTGIELNKLGYTNIDALDMSQEMLNEAKKKNVYKKIICAPLSEQPSPEIETGEYDALTCVNGLGNKHILQTAVVEMCRIVSEGKRGPFSFDDRWRRARGPEVWENKCGDGHRNSEKRAGWETEFPRWREL